MNEANYRLFSGLISKNYKPKKKSNTVFTDEDFEAVSKNPEASRLMDNFKRIR